MTTSAIGSIGPMHLGEFYVGDTAEKYRTLREHAPVYRHEFEDGAFWVLSKHADITAASKDPERFSSAEGFVAPGEGRDELNVLMVGTLLGMDPPDHTELRKLIKDYFAPREFNRMADEIRAYVRGILETVQPDEVFDVVERLAHTVPVYAIGVLLDIPVDERERFVAMVDAGVAYSDPALLGDTQGIEALLAGFGYFAELLESRAGKTGDDVITALANGTMYGEPIDQEIAVKTAFLLLIGGSETTRHLISVGVQLLIDHPEQKARLEADRSLVPTAVEEMLRYVSPVRYFARKTTTDLVIRDQVIAAGEWVMLLYASANRDEEVFGADADEFRIDRTPRPHLAFGHGTHFCLGARLARVEGQIVFEELLERFASWELAGEPVPVYGAELNGLKHLPVRFS